MDYDVSVLNEFLVILFLVLVNGVFVAAEFALVRSNPSHFRNTGGRRRLGSQTALRLMDDLDLTLSTVQLGITLASIILGWFGVQCFYNLFSNWLAALDLATATYAHGVLLFLSLSVVIFLHVVVGELAAKSLALRFPEATLRILSGFIFLVSQLCRPVIFVLSRSADVLLRAFGISRDSHFNRAHSLAELSFLVSKSSEGGLLDEEEEQMLRGVFGLSDTVAREVMTPRTDLIAVPADASFTDVLAIIRDSGLSRFPVKGESIDDILGILLARDVLSFVVPGVVQGTYARDEFSVRKLMREAYFIPGTKPIDDLLNEFKRRKLHLAIVLDEHGGVDGVVTLEDLIEEIVGDIFDESDVPEKSIVVQDNGEVLIDGGQLVADLNSRFFLEIPEGDYDTIAGFIFTSLGRMPRPGDSIVINRSEPAAVVEKPEEEVSAAEDPAEPAEPEPEKPPKALITVEKVQSYRIETVRLKPCFEEENTESPASPPSSHSLEPASEREI